MSRALPRVRLGERGPVTPPKQSYYKKDYQFTEDFFHRNIPIWEKLFAPYQGKPNLHYLEVGVWEGRSALWMIENVLTDPSSRITVIDPLFPSYRDRLLANIRKSGVETRATVIVGYSQVALRKIPLESCDFVYIDGSHKADDVLEDAVLSWRLVKKGGLLIFDDYPWVGWSRSEPPENRPGPAINTFYALYGHHFEVLHVEHQVIMRRKSQASHP